MSNGAIGCSASATPPLVNIASLRLAIAQLYGQSGTVTPHSAVSQWLSDVKASAAAWELLWLLLTPENSDMEKFLGATFLRDKMREQWRELAPTDVPELKSRVLDVTFRCYGDGVSFAAPLVESVAVLLVQTCCDVWPESVDELIGSCRSLPDQLLAARLLLSVLTEVPQQLLKCHITSSRQAEVKRYLITRSKQVIELVGNLLHQLTDDRISIKCMELLTAWIDLDCSPDDLLPVIDLVLIPFASSPTLAGATLELLDRLVSLPSNHSVPTVVLRLAKRVLSLQPLIAKLAQAGELDVLTALGNVFTNLASSHSRTFVSFLGETGEGGADGTEVAQQLVAAILELSSVAGHYPADETVSVLTFGVWYSIQDDILAAEEPIRGRVTRHLQPLYMKLLTVMLHKSMYPPNVDRMCADDMESFRKYRQDIQDFYTYTQSLLGSYILNTFIVYMHGAINAVREDASRWPALEAVLHGLAALGESHVDCESNGLESVDSMRSVLLALPDIPYGDNDRLSEAAFRLIDACSCTFDLHPACLQPLLPMLMAGLWRAPLALSVTMALKDICQDSPLAIAPHSTTVLHNCNEVLMRGVIGGRERVRLMYVVGALIGHLGDAEARINCLRSLVAPSVAAFKHQLGSADQKSTEYKQLLSQVNGFASLAAALAAAGSADHHESASCPGEPAVEQLSCHQLLQALLVELLPSLLALATAAGQHEQVAECICSFLSRCLVNSCSDSCQLPEQLLTSCLHVLSTLYSSQPHHQVLKVIQQLLIIPRNTACGNVMASALQQVCAASCSCFGDNPLQLPEAVAHFLAMLTMALKKHSHYVSGLQQQLTPLLRLACSCVQLPERHMMRSGCSFLSQFVEQARACSVLRQCVTQSGCDIVSALLSAIADRVPRDCVPYTADVFCALLLCCADLLSAWLRQLMSQPGFPSHRLTEQQKNVFIKHVLQGLRNKTILRDQVVRFCLLCRGLDGTKHVTVAARSVNDHQPPQSCPPTYN